MQVELLHSLADLPDLDWRDWSDDNPFVAPAFLRAMESTGCTTEETGWQPSHLILYDERHEPAGFMPMYLKTHSQGEFVFDMAWAHAFNQYGLQYYPKLLCAAPFSPVTGPRLIGRDRQARQVLAKAAIEVARRMQVSSVHVLFPAQRDLDILRESDYMIRESVQFHWKNEGYADFDQFMASLQYDKRKKLRQDSRKVARADITFEFRRGHEISAETLSFFYACYCNTYYERGRQPYLTQAFFTRLLHESPDSLLLVMALRHGEPIACAMNMIGNNIMYGRYWGAQQYIPGLHFETCYVQGIRYCIEHGIAVFEGGAQGEHKLSRGLLPQATYSAHWIARPEFADAIDRFLNEESRHVQAYLDELNEHSPFKDQETNRN
ncbi:GNAT family N-acetyltransferase [Advenella kashmirensis]|nr:GNAT family N-acetyltransferase [Advenella kashmirensis]